MSTTLATLRSLGLKAYNAYYGMLQRCRPGAKYHHRYHDRGIGVCAEWQLDRNAFLAHVGLPPTPKHQLDRIDNDRGYEPGNVRWASQRENVRNSSAATLLTIRGVTKLRCEWLEQAGLEESTFRYRMRNGWTAERAIETPPERNDMCRLAVRNGIGRAAFKARIKSGWPALRAATEPLHHRHGARLSAGPTPPTPKDTP